MHEVESLCDGRPDHCDLSPGEHATWIRDGEGTTGHFRAQPGQPSSRFSLYRRDMGPISGGPGPHFHRTYEETFIVVSGSVLLYDGLSWRHTYTPATCSMCPLAVKQRPPEYRPGVKRGTRCCCNRTTPENDRTAGQPAVLLTATGVRGGT